MKVRKGLGFVTTILAAILVVGCQSGEGEETENVELQGTSWIWAKRTSGRSAPALTFGPNGGLQGHSACNNFGGKYSQQESRLEIRSGPMTLMACPPDVSALERRILEAMPKVQSFAVADGRLTLLDESARTLLEYQPAPKLEGTSWRATGINTGNGVTGNKATGSIVLRLGSGSISGEFECGAISGAYEVADGTLKISHLEVADSCVTDPGRQMRAGLLESLPKTGVYKIAGDHLDLRDENGATMANFVLG